MVTNPKQNPDRSEKLLLAAAILRGLLSGAARAFISWLIEEHIH